jgi:hypothetical protein
MINHYHKIFALSSNSEIIYFTTFSLLTLKSNIPLKNFAPNNSLIKSIVLENFSSLISFQAPKSAPFSAGNFAILTTYTKQVSF